MKGSNNRRRYFTEAELGKLINAARKGRYGHRDATLVFIMARHGLRVTEAVDLEWDQVDFTRAHLHVRRLKGGTASVHPIQGDELRALRELRRQTEVAFVFGSGRPTDARRCAAADHFRDVGPGHWPAPFAAEDKRTLGLAAQLPECPQLIALDRIAPTRSRLLGAERGGGHERSRFDPHSRSTASLTRSPQPSGGFAVSSIA